MTSTLKFTNKILSLVLLLAILINITVPDLLPVLSVQAMPEMVENDSCELYPFAISLELLKDVNTEETLEVTASENPSGGFGWLSWTGNPSANRLAASLTPPGDSTTYINPDNPQDHHVSVGDWVKGMPGVANSKDIVVALDALKETAIIVPVWDEVRGEGNNSAYHVASFARIQILDYQLPKENRMTVKFLGYACAGQDDGVEKEKKKVENITLEVSKTVDTAVISYELTSSLSVDKEFAVPGDTLTYTTTISETPADFVLTGTFTAVNTSEVPAKITYFYDVTSFQQTETNSWKDLAGYSSTLAGFTPVTPSPIKNGMEFSAAGIAADGVTYPTQGDGISGTLLAPGSTAVWKYTAAMPITPDLYSQILEAAGINQIRNTVHFEAATENLENGQSFDALVDFGESLQSKSIASEGLTTQLTLPDASVVTPILTASETDDSYTAMDSYTVPVPPERGTDEIEEEYLARLTTLDGSLLTATLYIPDQMQNSVNTVVQLPIVTIDKDGPPAVLRGQTAVYDLTLTNVGSAPAAGFVVEDPLINGTAGTISGVPETLAPGDTVVVQAAHDIPSDQPTGDLLDLAILRWMDANGNPYGSLTALFSSDVISEFEIVTTSPVHGRFFATDSTGVFKAAPGMEPVFEKVFPTISFNPRTETVINNYTGVDFRTKPLTNVTVNSSGVYAGTIVAQGNGFQTNTNYNAVLTGQFTIPVAGDITFTFHVDDRYIFGVGGGASRVSGPYVNIPDPAITPFENYPIMGATNYDYFQSSTSVTVHFPEPGVYPYEFDYSQGINDQRCSLVNTRAKVVVTPTTSLVISPFTGQNLLVNTSQTFTVTATDASGAPLKNYPVTLLVRGANMQEMSAVTDDQGTAAFNYIGEAVGIDYVQAVSASEGSITAVSAEVKVVWK